MLIAQHPVPISLNWHARSAGDRFRLEAGALSLDALLDHGRVADGALLTAAHGRFLFDGAGAFVGLDAALGPLPDTSAASGLDAPFAIELKVSKSRDKDARHWSLQAWMTWSRLQIRDGADREVRQLADLEDAELGDLLSRTKHGHEYYEYHNLDVWLVHEAALDEQKRRVEETAHSYARAKANARRKKEGLFLGELRLAQAWREIAEHLRRLPYGCDVLDLTEDETTIAAFREWSRQQVDSVVDILAAQNRHRLACGMAPHGVELRGDQGPIGGWLREGDKAASARSAAV
ncbi:hypothetical protein [Rubellimicrobium roseum]|uniref:Uncharacterized protein n=1 Tax=Rubellimicrobium roseum TaxID=687525 RepID=A0A5C4N9X7_9RHOB|nr:hypothetical protein [Rubellimicrobium roseum]TNC68779.1 hypothetical protein FHG71_14230 [Rubellimicrobium roseum]